MSLRILVVEDEPILLETLAYNLNKQGYQVLTAADGYQAIALARKERPALLVLDLMLPGVDGFEVCRVLRQEMTMPILMLTARAEEIDKVVGLEVGADDYLVKPFGGEQLGARIRAVLRRSGETAPPGPLVVGGLAIDAATRQATLDGMPMELTRKEFDLLHLLASRAGEVVTRREILAEVWRQAYGGGDRTVDVHLSWLRRKLGETAAAPGYLHSVRGVGVRLVAPGG